jgi:hypothetical protein
MGLQVSPIWRYRSALPVNIVEGVDLNQDGVNQDLPARAYAFDRIGNPAKEIGDCKTINCGRGASLSQVNLRVSKGFAIAQGMRIEAIAEVFNLFNAKSPSGFGPSTQFRDPRLLIGADGQATPNPNFLQPTTYAGDFQEPEQRVGPDWVQVRLLIADCCLHACWLFDLRLEMAREGHLQISAL